MPLDSTRIYSPDSKYSVEVEDNFTLRQRIEERIKTTFVDDFGDTYHEDGRLLLRKGRLRKYLENEEIFLAASDEEQKRIIARWTLIYALTGFDRTQSLPLKVIAVLFLPVTVPLHLVRSLMKLILEAPFLALRDALWEAGERERSKGGLHLISAFFSYLFSIVSGLVHFFARTVLSPIEAARDTYRYFKKLGDEHDHSLAGRRAGKLLAGLRVLLSVAMIALSAALIVPMIIGMIAKAGNLLSAVNGVEFFAKLPIIPGLAKGFAWLVALTMKFMPLATQSMVTALVQFSILGALLVPAKKIIEDWLNAKLQRTKGQNSIPEPVMPGQPPSAPPTVGAAAGANVPNVPVGDFARGWARTDANMAVAKSEQRAALASSSAAGVAADVPSSSLKAVIAATSGAAAAGASGVGGNPFAAPSTSTTPAVRFGLVPRPADITAPTSAAAAGAASQQEQPLVYRAVVGAGR